ncbi:MAG: AMP-binding protein [Candidatus Lokiarchaeota archaeon]|nr:AMP-binding protein [Candidatus Lokiarchaeota archaeon]MBD3337467.1 AMP-binding protein [Candidatus Lokiarchaeota archaeon]
MPDLKDYSVDENKIWFTGGHWPEGVPKQLYDVEGIDITPMWKNYLNAANELDLWDEDICISVLGEYMERVKFKTLVDYAKKFGTFLYDTCGIRKGDVVAIDLPNSINFVTAYMGCQYIGAIAQGINPTYRPMELLHSLTMTDAKAFVMMDALYIAGPNSVLPKTKVKNVVSSNLLDFVTADEATLAKLRDNIPSFQDKVPDETEHYKVYRMKKIIEETEPKDIDVDIDPWNDPAVYLMTGGTTGLPKVAKLSHANLVANIYQIKPWTNLEKGMITIGSIPFFHSFGMTCVMNGALCIGMQMLLFPRPPDDESLCETINKLEAKNGIMYTGVEMLFKRLTDFAEQMGVDKFKEKYDIWKKLKYATQGAGPLHDYVRIPFEEIFCPIRVGYGLTETSPVVSVNPFWGPTKTGKLGLPLPGTDWAVFDANNFEAGPICDGTKEKGGFGIDNTGEICVCGPQVMLGYLGEQKEQEDNLKNWDNRRWLLTGDIGFMDEEGYCEIRDRKKSLIKVSGHSVFPKEVEELMGHHEMVDEVAVAALPDEHTGEAVKAWVTLKKEYKKGDDITSKQLKEWCLANMAKWKTPKYIEFVRKLPVSMTGKVQRRALQEKDLDKLEKGRKIKG